jgi:sulfoquinovosidase
MIISEGGVGRGLQPITAEMNVQGGGGNTMTSYGSPASYITNKQRAFVYSNTDIGIASFDKELTEILYWNTNLIEGHLFTGNSFMELTEKLSLHIGTMKPLPEWSQKGAIVGIVGGQQFVEDKYKLMKSLGLPMVGIWM